MVEKKIKSRYPGIRAFEQEERRLFFGREQETAELFSMVKVRPLTVLFSNSGMGKTSLINAGLIPQLEANYFFPVKLRLQDTSVSPAATVKRILEPYLRPENLARYAQFGAEQASLWEYLRACVFPGNAEPLTPVLIFDQFEEFFEHTPAHQQELVALLSDIIAERLPDTVQDFFRQIPRRERTDEQLEWFSPLKARIVFSIRADQMSQLDTLKNQIPTVLHDRFHLKALGKDSATAAIVRPALQENEQFDTLPFHYAPEALAEILDALSNQSQEIESFQLQLLCQHIEQQVRQRMNANRTGDIRITTDYFGGKEGVQTILNNYYENEISRLPAESATLARRFIEEGLIVNGRRVGLAEGVEQVQFGIDEDLLRQLLDSRLIRAETIHLGKIFEVSHDTLVAPILRSYERRKVEEEKHQARRQLEAEQTKRREAERRRNRARLFAIAGFTLFFISLFASYLAFKAYQVADKARSAAVVAEQEALTEKQRAEDAYEQLRTETQQREDAQFKEILQRGQSALVKSEYAEAVSAFRLALGLRPGDAPAQALLGQALQKLNVKARYESLMAEGNRLADAGGPSLVTARERYRQAQKLHYNDIETASRLTALEGPLDKYFSELVAKAETFYRTGNGYAEALALYQQALQVKPGDKEVLKQIRLCQEQLRN